jgi:hypothetical protein
MASTPGTIKPYSSLFAFCFAVNYAVAGAYLSIPYVFWHTGIIASLLTLIGIAILVAIPAFWTLETMARAQVRSLTTCTEFQFQNSTIY